MKFTLFTLRKLVEHLTVFLNKGRGGSIDESKMIPINRTIPFDPVTFIGKGSSIVWQDERSLRLSKVDPTKIAFQTTLRSGENSIQGEENLKRLIASGAVLLDAKVFQTLWEDKTLIPKSYKQLNNGKITFIFFPGTILQNSNGYRLVLHLYWEGGEWNWGYSWLGFGWDTSGLSAVLKRWRLGLFHLGFE